MIRRKMTIALLSTVASTALLGTVKFAGPALADDELTIPTRPRPTTTAPPTTPPTTPPTPPPPTTPPTTPPAPCITAVGDASRVDSPGIGAVTVTIEVCGGTMSTVSSTLSRSNYSLNTKALPAMDKLSLQYALIDINKVNYSGATLTSSAYRASLQSALDETGL